MYFKEALERMKSGIPMKLPSWGGYWEWDAEKDTIVMHTKEGAKLDIRDTQNVGYTLLNVCSPAWIPATAENTTLFGGTPAFGFDDAIRYLKRGAKVKRKGWNGKRQYIELAKNISYVSPTGGTYNCDHRDIGNAAIAFVGPAGIQLGWLASQADMLANDWTFADKED